jgi:hypothetical protein
MRRLAPLVAVAAIILGYPLSARADDADVSTPQVACTFCSYDRVPPPELAVCDTDGC